MPRNQNQADALWAQADEYATLANDPTASPETREMAQREYGNLIDAAQQAESAGGAR